MDQVSQLESTISRNWNVLQPQQNGRWEKSRLDFKPLADEVRPDRDPSSSLPYRLIDRQPSKAEDVLLAGLAHWGSVFGLPDIEVAQLRRVYVELPTEDWAWCGDPARTEKISLTNRISILKVFSA
jgi:hypothetical protein